MRRKRSRQTGEEAGRAPSSDGGFLDKILSLREVTDVVQPVLVKPRVSCFPLEPATSPLSPSLTDEEEDEERNRKRRKKQRDIGHRFKTREEEEVEKDEGRFVVRMAVTLVGEEGAATLRLHSLNHRGAEGGSGPAGMAVSVYRPNGFSTPPSLPIR